MALSQSGRTPDVVQYVERVRRNGAFTVALTNDPNSALAAAAEAVIPLCAGEERAVAATKTYVNQVAALGLLAAHAAGEGERFGEQMLSTADRLAELVSSLEERIAAIALPFAFAGRMFVIGRGAEFGSFVSATVNAPFRRTRSTYCTTSGVRPDCDSANTVAPDISSFAP